MAAASRVRLSSSSSSAESEDGRKNISVTSRTYERIAEKGKFKESFDDLLNRICEGFEQNEGKKRK